MEHAVIENLKVLRIGLTPHTRNGFGEDAPFPFFLPHGFHVPRGGVIDERRGHVGFVEGFEFHLGPRWLAVRAAQMVHDAPAGDAKQPLFEGTPGRSVAKIRHRFGYGDDGFLHDILGLRFAQAGLPGHIVKQFPIPIEKGPPTLLVVQAAQPAEQGASRHE